MVGLIRKEGVLSRYSRIVMMGTYCPALNAPSEPYCEVVEVTYGLVKNIEQVSPGLQKIQLHNLFHACMV